MKRTSVLLSISLLLMAGIAFAVDEKVDKPEQPGVLVVTSVPGPPSMSIVVHPAPEATDAHLPPTVWTYSPRTIQEMERSITLPRDVGLGDTIRLRINCATGAISLIDLRGDVIVSYPSIQRPEGNVRWGTGNSAAQDIEERKKEGSGVHVRTIPIR